MRLSFITADNMVYIDGIPYDADCSLLEERQIAAIQYNGTRSTTEFTTESRKNIETIVGLPVAAQVIYDNIYQPDGPAPPPNTPADLVRLKEDALDAVIDILSSDNPANNKLNQYIEARNERDNPNQNPNNP